MPMLPGGRMPAVVDRAIVSTGPGAPLGDAATLSLAEAVAAAEPDAEAEALAPALDDGAAEGLGEAVAHPASTRAASPVSTLAFVMRRS
jgi:hypothetical protein